MISGCWGLNFVILRFFCNPDGSLVVRTGAWVLQLCQCSGDSPPNTSILLLTCSPHLKWAFKLSWLCPCCLVVMPKGTELKNRGLSGIWLYLTFSFFSSLPGKIKISSTYQILEKEEWTAQEYFKYVFFLRGKNAMWFHSSHANIYVSKKKAKSERKVGLGCDVAFGTETWIYSCLGHWLPVWPRSSHTHLCARSWQDAGVGQNSFWYALLGARAVSRW